jgi:2-phospho-L-lactate guanylyltransferase (CobY/MobA/RfbA family)
MDDALNVILDYRAAVEARVIKALDRFDKESAMHIVMGYMPIVDIEHMADFIERD